MLLERFLGHGGRFLVSDGEDPSTADLLLRLGRALGRRVRLVNVPPLALQAGLRLIGRGAEAERLLGSFRVEASALRTATSSVQARLAPWAMTFDDSPSSRRQISTTHIRGKLRPLVMAPGR